MAPVVQCALRGIARAHVTAGTPRRVRLPLLFGMLLVGETLIPTWGPEGKVLRLCLCLSYFLMARSDEMFAADSGVVHPVLCLTRGDVAFFATSTQLRDTRGQQPDKVEVRFNGHKGDQEQVGSVPVRTRGEVRGPSSSFRADGGAVTLMLELMSCFQREGRWRSDAYKVYTRNNIEDPTRVSRKLASSKVAKGRQPGEGTVWGSK